MLSAASNYQRFSLQTGTSVPEVQGRYSFLLSRTNDLFVIRRSFSASSATEVRVLSSASRYGNFTLLTATPLAATGDDFDFALAQNLDVVPIKKYGTGTGSTEVHVWGTDEPVIRSPSLSARRTCRGRQPLLVLFVTSPSACDLSSA